MARKRFTDADKWEDEWFFRLSPFSKLVWLYILDRCDHAGFWKVNHPMAETCLGTRLDWTQIEKDLEGRVEPLQNGTIWFIPKFLKFQYPKELSDTCKPHKGVIALLRDRNSLERVRKLFGNSYLRVQDKEQDKDMYSKRESAEREIGPTDDELDLCRVPISQESPKGSHPVPRTFLDFRQGRGRLFMGKDKSDWEYTFRLYEWDACVAMYDALKDRERIYYADALTWLSDHYDLKDEDYARAQAN